MSRVYYAHYLVYAERGRTELLRQLGRSYRALEDDHGILLPVRQAHLRYHAPALYDDELAIVTALAQARRASLLFRTAVYRRADATLAAEAEVQLAAVAPDGEVRAFPPELLDSLRAAVTEAAP
jgi:acyl-CoA thioester hydrolase